MTSPGEERRKLVHLLAVDTLDPLCGGDETETAGAAVNGVSLCAACARRMADQVAAAERGRPIVRPALRRWAPRAARPRLRFTRR